VLIYFYFFGVIILSEACIALGDVMMLLGILRCCFYFGSIA